MNQFFGVGQIYLSSPCDPRTFWGHVLQAPYNTVMCTRVLDTFALFSDFDRNYCLSVFQPFRNRAAEGSAGS